MQEHLFLVCELLRANLYEFQKYNKENGDEPYFTLPHLQRIAQQVSQKRTHCLHILKWFQSIVYTMSNLFGSSATSKGLVLAELRASLKALIIISAHH